MASFNLIKAAVDSPTDEEWLSRAFPGANLIGFTPWHSARTIDWAVNSVLRGRVELVEATAWSDVNVPGALFGAGVDRQAADQVPNVVGRSRLREYVLALRDDTVAWFDGLPPADLEGTINLRAASSRPEYLAEPVWAEIADLDGIPKWQFLARPCMSHIRVHYGQSMAELEALRAANRVGA